MPDEIEAGGESFSVTIQPFEAIPYEEIASEEAFKAAVRTQRAYRQKLDDAGWRNTGEAINDITVTPDEPGADEYRVGGDVVQLAVAEFGRAPNQPPPPFDAIADWANEKGLQPEGDQSFEQMVESIRWAIAENGIEGFRPARQTALEEGPKFEESVKERLEREVEERSID